jgi:hypothetical protein
MKKRQGGLVRVGRAAGFSPGFGPKGPRRGRAALVTLVVAACLGVVVPVLAQVSAEYDLSWHVIAGGGGRMGGGQHTLQGTAGQAVTGPAAGGSHTLCSGFWCSPPVGDLGNRVYLPLVVREGP